MQARHLICGMAVAAMAILPVVARADALRDTGIGSGARALSLGEGGAAAGTGAESLFWNPAGIAGSSEPEFMLGHTRWIEDLNHEAAAAVLPLGELGVAGIAGSWQTFSGIEERDASGNLVKKFSMTTGSGSAAFARALGNRTSVGVSAGFQILNGVGINQKAVPLGAGFASDIGDLRVAASAQGLMVPLPVYQASAAWRVKSGGIGLSLTGGAILRQDENRAGAGAEAEVGRVLRLRVGYMMPFGKTDLRTLSNLTAGVGVAYQTLSIDYAFLPLGDLGQVHRIQVSLRMLDRAPAATQPAASTPASPPVTAASPTPEAPPGPGASGPSAAAAPSAAGTTPTAESPKPKKAVEMEFVVPANPGTQKTAP